ncbi:lysophospholipase-like protein 1 isoform X2 [Apostichopus japonicus]
MNGALSNVWFDRKKIAPTADECIESVDIACEEVGKILREEADSGISKNKIVIGGFSMGGALAYHLAYRFHRDIAGVFSLSSFINKDSIIYQEVKQVKNGLPPLFAAHGGKDPLVLFDWGVDTVKALESLGVSTVFHEFPRLHHELGVQELRLLEEWLSKILNV